MTLGDIATWAWKRLNRPDKSADAVEAAKDAYLMMCGAVPFDELRTKTAELPLVTTPGATYDQPADMLGVISIRMTNGNLKRRLRRSTARVYDAISQTPNGPPASYVRFGSKFEFMPEPNSTGMTYRIRYWKRPPINDGDNPPMDATVILVPEEWGILLKWETLFNLMNFVGLEDKAAMLVMPMPYPKQPYTAKMRMLEAGIIPRLWNDLCRTIDQREAIDEDFGMTVLSRRFTARG